MFSTQHKSLLTCCIIRVWQLALAKVRSGNQISLSSLHICIYLYAAVHLFNTRCVICIFDHYIFPSWFSCCLVHCWRSLASVFVFVFFNSGVLQSGFIIDRLFGFSLLGLFCLRLYGNGTSAQCQLASTSLMCTLKVRFELVLNAYFQRKINLSKIRL